MWKNPRNTVTYRNFAKLHTKTKCEICGSVYRLQLHHVIPVKENIDLLYSIENLQTVCRKCHKKLHSKTVSFSCKKQ